MSTIAPQTVSRLYDRRRRVLLLIAWSSTVLPLIVFAFLAWQAYKMQDEVRTSQDQLSHLKSEFAGLEAKKKGLEQEIAKAEADLKDQRASTKYYRDVTGIKVRYYRESDREVVVKALEPFGFKLELGNSPLIKNTAPNTIGYGGNFKPSEQDLKDIAVALVQAGFPLKRIAPAEKQPDPKLIQIYASEISERMCGMLNEEQIRAGLVCGPR